MNKIRAVIDQIEADQRQAHQVDAIPDDISITELAEDVVRGKRKLSQPQMRMLIELLPYYAPKLQAIADFRMRDERDFAVKLDRRLKHYHEEYLPKPN
jgi:hypothetical protein